MRFLGYTLGDETAPQAPPRPELFDDMGKFVEEAVTAGEIVATGGIAPTAMGAKIALKDGEFTVTDGPFTEAKELIAGYWIIEGKSKEEAIEWAKRIPAEVCEIGEVELRPFYELEDFVPGPAIESAKEFAKKLPGNSSSKG